MCKFIFYDKFFKKILSIFFFIGNNCPPEHIVPKISAILKSNPILGCYEHLIILSLKNVSIIHKIYLSSAFLDILTPFGSPVLPDVNIIYASLILISFLF